MEDVDLLKLLLEDDPVIGTAQLRPALVLCVIEELCRCAWLGRLRCICGADGLGGSAGGEEERSPVACSPEGARRATGNGRAPLRGVEGVVVGTTSSLALLGHWWLLPEGPAGAVVDGEDWCFVW
jgi:hypothetical protein